MKKTILSLVMLVMVVGIAQAQVPDAGWELFVIREASNGTDGPPTFVAGSSPGEIEVVTFSGGQKAGLGTDAINGATIGQISTLHIDRLDDLMVSGAPYAPYFNIWVTDGLGNYAVLANEPSDAEWASNRWDVADWNYLKTKRCKVYETIGASGGEPGTSWVATHTGLSSGLVFEDVADLIISPPPPAYITAGNGVGAGAPDVLGTNVAYGYNWIFGDTLANYVSGDPGVLVDNYSATASFSVTNITQGLGYGTIGAALAAANVGDEIVVANGIYNENITIPVGVHLHSANGAAATTIAGSGGAAVAINADNVELNGFTITNPTGTNAISATDRSGLHIHHNTITNIGNSALASYVHAVVIVCTATPVDDIVIENNDLSYIEAGEYSSASAITVGWSNGSEDVTNLVIQNNSIFYVRSNTSPWNVGHGAYGILLNHSGNAYAGQTVGALIQDNTIDDLEGLWSHGIGLEGDTPGAVVSGNVISNLIDHKSPSDAVAVMVEDNASLGTVSVTGNTFTNVNVGVANVVAGPDFVNATNNDWGDASGPFNPYQNPNATGAAVFGNVAYTPWVGRMTSTVADLGIDPTTHTLGTDGYGYWEGTPALGLDDDSAVGFAPGAFQANVPVGGTPNYTKYGFVPSVIFGRAVFVGELYRITYHTKKGTDHVSSPPDWFCQMYTDGTAHGWYGERINAEPYFSANLTETPGTWTQWTTDPGANNRLRFFDSNLSLGSYTDGFLQDMAYDLNYADQTIMLFGLATGTAWAEGFEGKLDGLTVELVSGETATFNFISGNAGGTVTPASTGPLPCSATATVTVNFEADAYTPDLYLFDAVVSATPGLDFGTITNLYPFGSVDDTYTFVAMSTGANEWTITGATRGLPGNPVTFDGTTGLFSIDFTATSDVVGDVTIESLVLRDPDNNTIPVNLTGATITYDCTAPAAVTAITASPGHNKVNVAWTHDGTDVDHFAVYSGLWYDTTVGNSAYPEYDDLAGATVPTAPSSPTVANTLGEWAGPMDVSGVNVLTHTWPNADDRGVYYYTVFAIDAAGNASAAPAVLDRATNYWLGDVAINGLVDVTDFTALGTHFGSSVATNSPGSPIDVGPTDDWSRLGIPLTDSVINFEDLMIFSLNFGVVTSAKEMPAISKSVDLEWILAANGDLALRLVDGSGLKGLNVRADVPVQLVEAGQLLDAQSELTFLKNIGQNLDVSVAVMGVNTAFSGTGDLFIVRGAEGLNPEDLHITARSVENKDLEINLTQGTGTLTPRVFTLKANYPNPFNPMTKISFSLPEAQNVRLNVYSLDGRKVATLLDETRGAGLHEVVWTGRNDDGQSVASGLYFYRIDAGPYSQVRKMTLMK